MCIDMRRTCHVLLYRISVITSLSSVRPPSLIHEFHSENRTPMTRLNIYVHKLRHRKIRPRRYTNKHNVEKRRQRRRV